MNDIIIMKISQPVHNASDDEFYVVNFIFTYLLLREDVLAIYVVAEIAALEVVDQEVEVVAVLECAVHVYEEFVVEFAEDFALVQD